MSGKLLTKKDVMEKLGISLPTLDRWIADKTISYIKLPQGVRFREEFLENWLDKRTIKAQKKIA